MNPPPSAPSLRSPALPSTAPPKGARDERAVVRRRIEWVVAGRLVVATVLLGGSVALGDEDVSSRALGWVAGAIYLVSLVSLFWLPVARRVSDVAIVQLIIDLGTTSVLVYLGGGAVSGFAFLYGVVVLWAAIVVGPRAAMGAAGSAVVLYLIIGVSLSNGWLARTGGAAVPAPASEENVSMLRNVVGLVLVGFLATLLAERLQRTGGALLRAEASAAGHARLTIDIVRSLTSGLIVVDAQGQIRSINEVGGRLLGTSTDSVVGDDITAYLPEAGPGDSRRGEGEARRHDGSTFPVGFTVAPLFADDESVRGTLVVFQDLTEIVGLRDQAQRAERLAALGRLAAGLAHEIRNPLGSISGSVELVRDSNVLGEEDRHLLNTVLREVARLDELVTTMLDVGRPRPPERTRVDLRHLAREIVEVAERGPSREGGIRVRLVEAAPGPGTEAESNDPERPLLVDADPGQLRQLLWNLVKNAIQFSPRNGLVEVFVGIEGTQVCLRVTDEGPGVAQEDRAQLFDMFFTKRRHGVGLGLALVKQIVDAHGASIRVDEGPAGGASFVILLPAASSQRVSPVSPAPAHDDASLS